MVALFAQQSNILEFPQKNNEYYTPAQYIEAARQTMGGIDLDPASCELANRTVKAKRYFTKEDSGLEKLWNGNVWLNPPYLSNDGKVSMYSVWTRKLLDEYQVGRVKQAITLISVHTERKWFQGLHGFLICFADHQIFFVRPGQHPYHIYHAACFIYLGANEQKFIDTFGQFGPVYKRVSVPKVQPVNLGLWEVH